MKKLFLILLIGIVSLHYASGLGVSPARATIDFEPNLQKTVEVTIVGSGEGEKQLTVSVAGELSRYVTVSTTKVVLKESETKQLSYDLRLPELLDPGLHIAEIIILEEPKNENKKEIVQATLAVKTQIHVHVPTPGKYANVDVFTTELNEKTIRFMIPIVSVGTYDLAKVRANIDTYNLLGEKIDSFNNKTISVPSGERAELVYDWEHGQPVGNYLAKVTLIYDEETRGIEKEFRIGSKVLELQEIRVDNFQLGGIAKFEMLVENKWSEDFTDVYVDTKIFDAQKQTLAHFKSPLETVAALSKQLFTSYWDTAGFSTGTYDTDVEIHYGQELTSKSLQFKIEENEITVIGLGYVISSGGDANGQSSLVTILIGVVAILILVNLLWFIILRKRLRKK